MLGRPPANGTKRSTTGLMGTSESPVAYYPIAASQRQTPEIAISSASVDRDFSRHSLSRTYEEFTSNLNLTAADFPGAPELELADAPESLQATLPIVMRGHNRANTVRQAKTLIALLRENPAVAHYLLRYAQLVSREPLQSLETAIDDVLGCEYAGLMALGLFSLDHFHNLRKSSPINRAVFWRDALYSAELMQRLAGLADKDAGLDPVLAYYCGLFHKIGILVLADGFSEHYEQISQTLANSEDVSLVYLERQLLGVDHAEAGAQLLARWGFAADVALVSRHHTDPNYLGPAANYVYLCRVAKGLLSQRGMCICRQAYRAAPAIAALGIRAEAAQSAAEKTVADMTILDDLAEIFPHS